MTPGSVGGGLDEDPDWRFGCRPRVPGAPPRTPVSYVICGMPVVPSAGEEVLWSLRAAPRREYRGARGQDQWSASAVPLQGALIWLPGAKAWCAGAPA